MGLGFSVEFGGRKKFLFFSVAGGVTQNYLKSTLLVMGEILNHVFFCPLLSNFFPSIWTNFIQRKKKPILSFSIERAKETTDFTISRSETVTNHIIIVRF